MNEKAKEYSEKTVEELKNDEVFMQRFLDYFEKKLAIFKSFNETNGRSIVRKFNKHKKEYADIHDFCFGKF